MTKFIPQAIQKDIQPVETGALPNPLKEALLSAGERRPGPSREKPIQKHRSIFLSDMHLGTRSSRADLILDFLETHSAETVYLVGDIVDNWYPLSKWKSAHHQVLQRLFVLPRAGTRVIYVPGNHDDFFRNYAGTSFGGIEIELDLVHHATDGRRYLVTHGDICDAFSAKSPLLERAGRLIERIATGADVAQRHVLRREGQPEWFGIERAISRTSAVVRKYDNFEERLAALAKSGGYDGIICGHYHQPALHDDFGTTYANCGDWARNNTAIVEDFNGRLDLLWAYDNAAFEPQNWKGLRKGGRAAARGSDMTVTLIVLLAGFFCVVAGLHVLTCALVIWRLRGSDPLQATGTHPPLSVIRPVCGLDTYLYETLATSFSDLAGDYEVIFCVADFDDPAIPVIRGLIADHPEDCARLLIGNDVISGNPKLNNVAKGWSAARHDSIVIIDSNVLLPRDYMQTLYATWRQDTGLVTSPPVGIRAEGIWARVESAFLNTYQDRWQMASDQLGNGFAQGKVLFWQRHLLESAGGLAVLGRDLAEDVASTKVVRAAGLKVRVVRRPFPQPLGQRGFGEVWSRQLRWARVRRDGFPLLFALEPLTGMLIPLAAVVTLALLGVVSLLVVPLFLCLWYGTELVVARQANWPATVADILTWFIRDFLIVAIWLNAFSAKGFVWRGNAMQPPPLQTAD